LGRLGRAFFGRRSTVVAREVVGKILVRVVDGERLAGVIVEAEAYRGADDPASHAYRGRTRRNEVMFGEPGHAYVYFTYGSSWCLNLTCERAGVPAAVLVRAVEPLEGLGEMMANRGVTDILNVASGPGKLTQALRIGREFNGEDLVTSERLFVEDRSARHRVLTSTRVGVVKGVEMRWRFYAEGNGFVSRGKPARHPQNP
jgi:DNA-3-methyladenine glycosylase